jgi:hypothetical protein
MKTSCVLSFLAMGLVASFAQAAPISLLDPTMGSNTAPFGYSAPGVTERRYQQAYSSASFDSALMIEDISFFRTSVAGNLQNGAYTLSLSTVLTAINSLSTTNFDANLGANNQEFVTITLAGVAPAVLTFTGTPFYYNPEAGNLLLDIRVTDIVPATPFPASFAFSSTASGVVSRYTNYVASGFTGRGLATQFDGVPVPEPTSIALVVSLAALSLVRSRCR